MTDKDIENIVISTKDQRIKLSNNLVLRVGSIKIFIWEQLGTLLKN